MAAKNIFENTEKNKKISYGKYFKEDKIKTVQFPVQTKM